MKLWSHLLGWVRGSHTLGASPGADRSFLVCYYCRRVVPAWRVLSTVKKAPREVGCRCGSEYVRPAVIPSLTAAWWLFVRGIFVRLVVLRRADWDPRIPVQAPIQESDRAATSVRA